MTEETDLEKVRARAKAVAEQQRVERAREKARALGQSSAPAKSLLERFNAGVEGVTQTIGEPVDRFSAGLVQGVAAPVQAGLDIVAPSAGDWLTRHVNSAVGKIAPAAPSWVGGIAQTIGQTAPVIAAAGLLPEVGLFEGSTVLGQALRGGAAGAGAGFLSYEEGKDAAERNEGRLIDTLLGGVVGAPVGAAVGEVTRLLNSRETQKIAKRIEGAYADNDPALTAARTKINASVENATYYANRMAADVEAERDKFGPINLGEDIEGLQKTLDAGLAAVGKNSEANKLLRDVQRRLQPVEAEAAARKEVEETVAAELPPAYKPPKGAVGPINRFLARKGSSWEGLSPEARADFVSAEQRRFVAAGGAPGDLAEHPLVRAHFTEPLVPGVKDPVKYHAEQARWHEGEAARFQAMLDSPRSWRMGSGFQETQYPTGWLEDHVKYQRNVAFDQRVLADKADEIVRRKVAAARPPAEILDRAPPSPIQISGAAYRWSPEENLYVHQASGQPLPRKTSDQIVLAQTGKIPPAAGEMAEGLTSRYEIKPRDLKYTVERLDEYLRPKLKGVGGQTAKLGEEDRYLSDLKGQLDGILARTETPKIVRLQQRADAYYAERLKPYEDTRLREWAVSDPLKKAQLPVDVALGEDSHFAKKVADQLGVRGRAAVEGAVVKKAMDHAFDPATQQIDSVKFLKFISDAPNAKLFFTPDTTEALKGLSQMFRETNLRAGKSPTLDYKVPRQAQYLAGLAAIVGLPYHPAQMVGALGAAALVGPVFKKVESLLTDSFGRSLLVAAANAKPGSPRMARILRTINRRFLPPLIAAAESPPASPAPASQPPPPQR